MKQKSWRGWSLLLMVGLLGSAAGCQTWFPEAGLTLPTGEYLRHYPQYFPPTPPFPLPREQAGLEEATAAQLGGPRPVVPGPGGP